MTTVETDSAGRRGRMWRGVAQGRSGGLGAARAGALLVLTAALGGPAGAGEVWDAWDSYSYAGQNPHEGWTYMFQDTATKQFGLLTFGGTGLWQGPGSAAMFQNQAQPLDRWQAASTTADVVRGWAAPYAGVAHVTATETVRLFYPAQSPDGVRVQIKKNGNLVYDQLLQTGGTTSVTLDEWIGVQANDVLTFHVNHNTQWDGSGEATVFDPIIDLERSWDAGRWREPLAWELDSATGFQIYDVDGWWFQEYAQGVPRGPGVGTPMAWEDGSVDPNGLGPRWEGQNPASNGWCYIRQSNQATALSDSTRAFLCPVDAAVRITTRPGNEVRKPWVAWGGDGSDIQIWHTSAAAGGDVLVFEQHLDPDAVAGSGKEIALDETVAVQAGDVLWFQNDRAQVDWFDEVIYQPVVDVIAVENGLLRATVLPDGGFAVTDLRIGHTWRTADTGGSHAPQDLRVSGAHAIEWTHPGGWACRLALDPDAAELTFELDGNPGAPFTGSLAYPFPFYAETSSARVALPSFEGLLLPVRGYTDAQYAWNSPQASDWVGLVDMQAGFGCMTILESFPDAEFEKRVVPASTGEDLLTFGVEHTGEKQTLGYRRVLTYSFHDAGGHVALAKRYRTWVQEAGYFRTLRDKALQNPDVDKLKGAVNVYFRNPGRLDHFAQWLANLGVDRAVISAYSKGHEPGFCAPVTVGQHVPAAIAGGYLVTSYDIYSDTADPVTSPPGPWTFWERYSQLLYPQDTVKRLDPMGTPVPHEGWYAFNYTYPATGTTVNVQTYVTCPEIRHQLLQQYLPCHLGRFPSNAHFLDVESKVGFYQCYDAVHPRTRREDLSFRLQMASYIAGNGPGELNLVYGSEGGAFWALEDQHYSEDMLSIAAGQHFAAPLPAGELEGPITYPFPELEFDHTLRAPLWSLAFHDGLVSSYRWGQGNLRGWDMMWKKDLFNLLYGAAPLWHLRGEGNAFAVDETARMAQTFQMVCEVNEYTQFDEMLDHEFVAGTNMDVQRTTWEGGLSITVNLSDTTPYTVGSHTLGPATYLLEGDPATYPTLTLGQVQQAPLAWQKTAVSQDPFPDGSFTGQFLPLWRHSPLNVLTFNNEGPGESTVSLEVDARGPAPAHAGVHGYEFSAAPLGALELGKEYRFTAWMKVLSSPIDDQGGIVAQAYPRVMFVSLDDPQDPNKKLSWNEFSLVATNPTPQHGVWKKYELVMKIPANHRYGLLKLGRWRPDQKPAHFLVDDVQVVATGN